MMLETDHAHSWVVLPVVWTHEPTCEVWSHTTEHHVGE